MKGISVLCVNSKHTNYKLFPDLDLWDETRDAYNFNSENHVIAHPPCAQWSRLHKFAKENKKEKDLAMFCLDLVQRNGGIFEHPHGSHFFKYAGIKPTIHVDQHWFGFPCKKQTWLYYAQVEPAQFPLNFNAVEGKVEYMDKRFRSVTPVAMIEFFLKSFKKP